MKSSPTPGGWREESRYVTERVPIAGRSTSRTFGSTTVGGGSFGWCWGDGFRWRCRGFYGGAACVAASGSPTTHPFALPRKRFVQQPVLAKASEYLGTDHTYRQTVMHKGMSIVYDDRVAKGKWHPVGLSPSTVWRWLSWLGGMPNTLQAVMGLIREKDPNATLHRELWVVPAGKYRSQRRRDTLQRAMQLLVADRVCAKLFGKGIFPRYGIVRGWS